MKRFKIFSLKFLFFISFSVTIFFYFLPFKTLYYRLTAKTLYITEKPLAVGEKRDLYVEPYGMLAFDEAKISVMETTIKDKPVLVVVGLEVGDTFIEIIKYNKGSVVYKIPIKERKLSLIALDINTGCSFGPSPEEKIKLTTEWCETAEQILEKEKAKPDTLYRAFEFYYRAELMLRGIEKHPTLLHKEVEAKQKQIVKELDQIFKSQRRLFQEAFNKGDKARAQKIVDALKLVFPNEKYHHPETKENYRRLMVWMQNRVDLIK